MKINQARAGFTLIEILIAIALVAIMATLGVVFIGGQREKAKKNAARTMLQTFDNAIELFHGDIGQYPNTLQDLVEKPTDPKLAKKWDVRYLKKEEIPDDPWNNEYQYKRTPGGRHPYELYSFGPQGPDAPEEEWLSVWK